MDLNNIVFLVDFKEELEDEDFNYLHYEILSKIKCCIGTKFSQKFNVWEFILNFNCKKIIQDNLEKQLNSLLKVYKGSIVKENYIKEVCMEFE